MSGYPHVVDDQQVRLQVAVQHTFLAAIYLVVKEVANDIEDTAVNVGP